MSWFGLSRDPAPYGGQQQLHRDVGAAVVKTLVLEALDEQQSKQQEYRSALGGVTAAANRLMEIGAQSVDLVRGPHG